MSNRSREAVLSGGGVWSDRSPFAQIIAREYKNEEEGGIWVGRHKHKFPIVGADLRVRPFSPDDASHPVSAASPYGSVW